jgi:hypothetical protein
MSNLAVNTITNAAGGNTAQINGMTPTADSLQGFRNRIINGDMRIDQRNNGASVTPTVDAQYGSCDRWSYFLSQASKFSVQQNAGSVTPPAGFTNYLGITSLSAYTLTGNDNFEIVQKVEGFNSADLGWGTANAQAITLSFWVRSSLTGTFGGGISNSAYNRSYPFAYTINAANTWEQKTITIPGDTSGTWLTNNGLGLVLQLALGATGSRLGTAGAWAAGWFPSVTGAVSVVSTNGATFYITGVQLEAGSVATPFERRPYGTELALCQRYYEKSYPASTTPGTANSVGAYEANNTSYGNNIAYGPPFSYKVTKRASPTVTAYSYSGTTGQWHYARSGVGESLVTFTLTGTANESLFAPRIDVGAGWVPCYVIGHWTASAEL